MKPLAAERGINSAIHRSKRTIRHELVQHPVGVAIGAIFGGGAVAATTALMAGPLGIMAGLIAGVLTGGFAGNAVASMIRVSRAETVKDPHPLLTSGSPDESTGRVSIDHGPSSMPKAFREQWHHLDESSKDLIKGSAFEETDERSS